MTDFDSMPIPGTVQLIDEDGHLHVKHASTSGTENIVLIPSPSDDPEDPLNWSRLRKLLSTSCIVIYTLMVVIPSTAVYSVTSPISKETSLTVDNLVTGLGIMFLFAGWECIPLQALALQYGKRPMYLISLAGNLVVMVLAPKCTHWSLYIVNKILHGVFTAPVESLCEISITDIWFSHERPRYLAVYGFALALAAKLAPSLAGFINYSQGWQWTLYWCGIWIGIAFVYCFLLMEETNYDRQRPVIPAKAVTKLQGVEEKSSKQLPVSLLKDEEATKIDTTVASDVEPGFTQAPRKRSYWQKLSIWPEKRPMRLLSVMWGPIRFFSYPVVVYAGFMYGANGLVWSAILNSTAGTIYPNTYGFSTAGIASAYLAGCVGVVVGALYCGKVGEVLIVRLAKRNNGIAEAEHILWTFIASLIFVPFSLLLWGLGASYKVHWVALVFAQGSLSVSNAIACPMALAYAISCYPEMSGELVTTTVVIRNTMSFAVNYGITPWIQAQGLRDCFITVAAIGFVCNSSMFVMMRYGKRLRAMSAGRYWATLERARKEGASH